MQSKYSLAIKFFTETKNEEQINLAYKEIESFLTTYEEFSFYYLFDPLKIENWIVEGLSEEYKFIIIK
jgi:hypothetical protein